MVKTAGDNGAVAQYTHLIPQAVTKSAFPTVGGGKIRPVEFVAVFQIDPLGDLRAPWLYIPRCGERPFHGAENFRVSLFRTAAVPQAVNNQKFPLRRLPEGKTPGKVRFKGDGKIVCFKGMERNIHLVKRGGVQQNFPLFFQQSPVGGENDPEARFPRKTKKFRKLRMAQRLAHQMEVKIVRPWAQFGQQGGKRLHRHELLFPPGAGAECAVQVADVGDLQIDFSQPLHSVTSFSKSIPQNGDSRNTANFALPFDFPQIRQAPRGKLVKNTAEQCRQGRKWGI